MNVQLLVVLLIVIVGGVWTILRSRPDVSGAEARALVAGGATLLDVRTPGEFKSAHLPGAINVPVEALERRLQDVGPKDQPVVVYCASGARSSNARRVLLANGWTQVRNMGPMGAWWAAGA